MPELKAARAAQWPVVAEFIFNFNDTAKDSVSGVVKTFGSAISDLVLDAINMPPGAVIQSGELVVETAYSAAATLAIGTAAAPTSLLGATSLAAIARTPLLSTVPLMMGSFNGANIRITLAAAGPVTAGKARVRVTYTTDGTADKVISS